MAKIQLQIRWKLAGKLETRLKIVHSEQIATKALFRGSLPRGSLEAQCGGRILRMCQDEVPPKFDLGLAVKSFINHDFNVISSDVCREYPVIYLSLCYPCWFLGLCQDELDILARVSLLSGVLNWLIQWAYV